MSRWRVLVAALVGIGVAAGLSAAADLDGQFMALLATPPGREPGVWGALGRGWASSPAFSEGLARLATILGLAIAGFLACSRVRRSERGLDLEADTAPAADYRVSPQSAAE